MEHRTSVGLSSVLWSTRISTQPDSKAAGLPTLIDVDANLLHESLRENIDEHIRLASDVGVKSFVVPGSNFVDTMEAIALSKQYPAGVIIATAGVHPYHVEGCGDVNVGMDLLKSVIMNDISHIAACGEFGLDFSEGFPPAELQIPYFEAQLSLACSVGKPLFLHERAAHAKFCEIMKAAELEHGGLPPALVHCFTGAAEELDVYLSMGFYIGITGFVLKRPQGDALRECVGRIPLDRIMIETDAPYQGFPGCRVGNSKPQRQSPNVPSSLPLVAKEVANLLGVSLETLASASTANARKFFNIAHPS